MPDTSPPALFITGAAAGIGRAVALRFGRAGWVLGLYDVNEDGARALAREIGESRCIAGRLDVTQAADWERALTQFADHSGQRLDVLFNNAGIAATAPFTEIPLARHHQLLDINLKGVVNGCHLAYPLLRGTPRSRVINMASASAIHGQPDLATYSASKAAIRSLTEALDIEWRKHGIRVVDLLPLFVNTAMVKDEVSRMQTVARLGVHLQPEDIAEQVWRLANGKPQQLPTHTYVGAQTKLFALASRLSPDAVNRWITARLAGY